MTDRTNRADRAYALPNEAAAQLGVSVRTVGRMADRGEIDFIKLPSGHRRYILSSLPHLTSSVAAPNDGPQTGEAPPTASPVTPLAESA